VAQAAAAMNKPVIANAIDPLSISSVAKTSGSAAETSDVPCEAVVNTLAAMASGELAFGKCRQPGSTLGVL
jgi:hypothetical protein